MPKHSIATVACLCWIACLGCDARGPQPTPPLQSPSAKVSPQLPANSPPAASGDSEWQFQVRQAREGAADRIQIDAQVVSRVELEELKQIPNLTELLLDAGAVYDDDLAPIAELKKLEHLRLRDSPLTDSGAELLASSLPELRVLNMPQAQLTAAGIRKLAGIPNLTQLRLGGKQIDDEALRALASLPALRSLHLIGPSLSEAGLEALATAPNLSSFYLDDCPLSDAAWEQLFAAKPGLHVHIDQVHHDRDPSDHVH